MLQGLWFTYSALFFQEGYDDENDKKNNKQTLT